MKGIIRIIILFCSCIPVSGMEEVRIETITSRDGLSQNTVRYIMQDHNGFMWLGTMNGLNRYDGKQFIVMQPGTGDQMYLSDNRVRGITDDGNGCIWIRTYSDMINCYEQKTESFIDFIPGSRSKRFGDLEIFPSGDIWMWGKENGCCRIRHNGDVLDAWLLDEMTVGNIVNCLWEDSDGIVWIGTDEKLYRVNGTDVVPCTGELTTLNFHNIAETRNYICCITTNNRMLVFDRRSKEYLYEYTVPHKEQLLLNSASTLENDRVLLTTKAGSYVFDAGAHRFYSASGIFSGKDLQNAFCMMDNRNNLWVYNMTGSLWQYNREKDLFSEHQLIPQHILSVIDHERYMVYHDSRDIVWVTTYGNGLFALDQKDGSRHHFTSLPGQSNHIASNYLICITEDKSGEIWIGYEFSGVSKISLSNYPVTVYYPDPGGSSNRSNAVRLIYGDSSGRVWLGARSGYLYVCDSSLNKLYTHYIPGGLPYAMAEDHLGNKWLGTRGKGVMVFPPSGNGSPKNYLLHDHEKQTSSSNNIFGLLRDSKNRMWAATFGGGLHVADNTGPDPEFRQILSRTQNQDMMRCIIQDRKGLIWVGSNEGVNAFDPDLLIQDKTRYVNFTVENGNDRTLNNNEVKAVFEDSKGRIWLGTTGGGLNLLMREDPVENSWFRHFTARNGLADEVIQSILEDDNGNIWVSTESGISMFDPEMERFDNFTFSDVQQSNLFNENSCRKGKNGKLMFGSYLGMYIFDPSRITIDTYSPPVFITGLKINGNKVYPKGKDSPLDESITYAGGIRLRHDQASFNLEYAMLNYRTPDQNKYVYMLEGYEKDWNPVTSYSEVTYRNVPPGSYRFMVKGSNSFGVWNEDATVLDITIEPPLWKSPWALLVYLVVFLLAGWIAYRVIVKLNRLNMAVAVEKQLTEYKLRFFTNISHEFRTPLTIIRGAIENLTHQQSLPASVGSQVKILAKSSSRLLRLIDQLLEFRRLQNDRMDLKVEPTEAVGFVYDIYETFGELARKKGIRFLFESDTDRYDMLIDRGKMDKIVYNLLSNAFKYTPENGTIMIRLNFSPKEDLFVLSVSDSGSGIPKDKRNMLFVRFKQINYNSGGTGVGLHLVSELAMVHKGNIEYSDSEFGGACFRVSVPLSADNYSQEDQAPAASSVSPPGTIELPDSMQGQEDVNGPFSSYKLLVIEDDEDVREFLQVQLSRSFTVRTAKDGLEGLEKAGEEQPDLVVCDVMMPGMDGFEVTQKLKSDFQSSHIPVIMLTAHSSEKHQLEGIQAGADAYIIKPFSLQYLVARIVKLIEQREKLRRKFAEEPGLVRPLINTTDKDKEFLDKLHDIIEKNIGNADFTVDLFTQAIGLGRSVFYKKTKGITGHSPSEYLRIVRMKKAAELLVTTGLNVSEVSYQVGINDPLYFSRCFKAQFGKSPSQYQKAGTLN